MEQNQSEFVKLLTEHQQVLRSFIISMLPGCDEVKDVLQDTNVVLWEKMNSFEPGTNFRAWAFSVARNKVLQYRERRKRAGKLVWNPEVLEAIEEHRCETLPDYLEAKLSALKQCIDSLKGSEREMIRERYIENQHSRLEPNAVLSGSIRVTLCRIRRKLRVCVEKRIRWKGLEA